MEFKLNGTAEEALQQINDKHYALPFETDGRRLFKIGVNFSAETRNIENGLLNNDSVISIILNMFIFHFYPASYY